MLPWRDQADPYLVWVSEIMLQQTRVEAVVPYFNRWIERFPTVEALAAASEREVLGLWEGLGYYARARNLRRTAQLLVEGHGGQLPRTVDELRQLPGIGRYTAGAIASIAFAQDEPALDANIRRVLARVFNVTEPADSAGGTTRLWALAEQQLPRRPVRSRGADRRGTAAHLAGDYNQALMDLGAMICLPARPRCGECPVNKLCEARKLGLQSQRPVKRARKDIPHRVFAAAVVVRRGRVLLAQRPSHGLLGGLWEFPKGEVRGLPSRGLVSAVRKMHALEVKPGEAIGVVHHGYSHFTADVHAFHCTAGPIPREKNLRWARIAELAQFPMGKIDRQIARMLA